MKESQLRKIIREIIAERENNTRGKGPRGDGNTGPTPASGTGPTPKVNLGPGGDKATPLKGPATPPEPYSGPCYGPPSSTYFPGNVIMSPEAMLDQIWPGGSNICDCTTGLNNVGQAVEGCAPPNEYFAQYGPGDCVPSFHCTLWTTMGYGGPNDNPIGMDAPLGMCCPSTSVGGSQGADGGDCINVDSGQDLGFGCNAQWEEGDTNW